MRSPSFATFRVEDLSGKIYFKHGEFYSSSNAFELNELSKIIIQLPRMLGVVSVAVHIFDEGFCSEKLSFSAFWSDSKKEYDVYEASFDTVKLGVGLYFFSVEIDSQCGKIYAIKSGTELSFSYENSVAMHQLSISDFKYNKCDNRLGGIIYHIFVDRFNKGGEVQYKPGAITDDDWHIIPEYPAYPGAPLKNNHFYGGTLWGIANKLDYIKSLGVNTIYLSPIFEAASNHKYDTGDYMTVDAMFGGEDALIDLISAAKEKGIGIILDGVFNHTGSDSVYFNREGRYADVGAYQSKKSRYFNWYDFQDHPNKYTCWWGIDILPRIHPDRPSCGKYFVGNGGVVDKYAKLGIDGFRLDVADELSDEFISQIKKRLDRHNKHSVLYGEVWEDASNKIAYDVRKRYYLGDELDGVMNYPIRTGIIDFLTSGNTSSIVYALTDVIDNAPKRIRDMQMNLLGTHDTERILTVLGGEHPQGRSNDYLAQKRMSDLERGIAKRRLRMAYVILATIPGIPAIFYGDEAGLEGYHDPFNRMPYPWGREDHKLIDYFREIGKIRTNNNVYKDGDFQFLYADVDTLLFERYDCEYSYVTFVNNTKHLKEIRFSDEAQALVSYDYKKSSCAIFNLPAYTAQIFKIKRHNKIYF